MSEQEPERIHFEVNGRSYTLERMEPLTVEEAFDGEDYRDPPWYWEAWWTVSYAVWQRWARVCHRFSGNHTWNIGLGSFDGRPARRGCFCGHWEEA